MSAITTTYHPGGTATEPVTILYDEGEGYFYSQFEHPERGTVVIKNPNLAKLKEAISRRFEPPKAGAVRVPIIVVGNRYGDGTSVTKGTATSLVESRYSYRDKQARVSVKNGSSVTSSQMECKFLYADTPENHAIVEQMKALEKQEATLAKQRRELHGTLVKADLSKLESEED